MTSNHIEERVNGAPRVVSTCAIYPEQRKKLRTTTAPVIHRCLLDYGALALSPSRLFTHTQTHPSLRLNHDQQSRLSH